MQGVPCSEKDLPPEVVNWVQNPNTLDMVGSHLREQGHLVHRGGTGGWGVGA